MKSMAYKVMRFPALVLILRRCSAVNSRLASEASAKDGLKGFFERSRIPFNRFRASAGGMNQAGKFTAIYFSLCFSFSLYPLAYDKALYAAQNNKWQDAYQQLNAILVDSPDNAGVLYDAGVAATH